MYIRGLIPRNSAELAEAVPIGKQTANNPIHEMMVLIVCIKKKLLNMHAHLSNSAKMPKHFLSRQNQLMDYSFLFDTINLR